MLEFFWAQCLHRTRAQCSARDSYVTRPATTMICESGISNHTCQKVQCLPLVHGCGCRQLTAFVKRIVALLMCTVRMSE